MNDLATITIRCVRPPRKWRAARWEARVTLTGWIKPGLRTIPTEIGLGYGNGCSVQPFTGRTLSEARRIAVAAAPSNAQVVIRVEP